MTLDSRSILFITLDSCRYDTFEAAKAPNLKSVGELYQAMAPGNFTFASHAAMFVGFTPGVAERRQPYVNPKLCKIFKMEGAGFVGNSEPFLTLPGRNIVDGLNRLGHLTLGSGAVEWFNPATATAKQLIGDFAKFYFHGTSYALDHQLAWLERELATADQPVFAFLNVGETHVPYYYAGALWDPRVNPCVPFGPNNDARECRVRQLACLEWVDRRLSNILDRFQNATIVVCGDHGDAWGEDGLWEHGIHHRAVLEVPLLFRLGGRPAQMP